MNENQKNAQTDRAQLRRDLKKQIEKKSNELKSYLTDSDIDIHIYKDIDIESLIKTTKISHKTVEIGNGILNNEFFFLGNLEIIKFGKQIDWNYQHNNAANTYQLYIQTLNVVSYLCDAYIETEDDIYLYKAYSLLLDWIHYSKVNHEENKYKWVDHTVANRVLTIIYFMNLSKGIIDINEKLLLETLTFHGDFLKDDQNYVRNNHGIMVDRSLLVLSIFLHKYFKSNEWYEKAKLRIRDAFFRDFSFQGVHLENSPAYHKMVRNMFEKIQDFLLSQERTLGDDVHQKLKMTKNYLKYILKPNGYLPTIGDTALSKLNVKRHNNSFHDPEAGITIMQSKSQKEIETTWISFVCGYGSKTHKHRDDLSLNIFFKGKDILLDSGQYNYDLKDKFRKYILSPQAHSTIFQKNKTYKIKPPFENQELIKTVNFTSNSIYDYVKGIHKGYEGFSLQRSILFLKPDIIFIYDKVVSEEIKIFQQNFNLAPHVNVLDLNRNKTICSSNGEKIIFDQLIKVGQIQKFSGDRETPRAVISEKFGKIIDNTQIVFSTKGSNIQFLTAIYLGDKAKSKLADIDFNTTKELLSFKLNKQEYNLIL